MTNGDIYDRDYRARRIAELRANAAAKARPQSATGDPSTWTWREAENAVADWLRLHNEQQIVVGRGTHDGGVDVETSRWVVQVKHWGGRVGAEAVRQIFGVATARGKAAMVVTLNGFTVDALAFAEQAGVALYVYRDGQFVAFS